MRITNFVKRLHGGKLRDAHLFKLGVHDGKRVMMTIRQNSRDGFTSEFMDIILTQDEVDFLVEELEPNWSGH